MDREMNVRLVIRADGTAAVTVVKQTTTSVEGLGDAQKRNTSTTRQSTDAAAAYIAELKKQVAGLNATSQALRETEARARGATEAQLAEVRALGAQLDAHTNKVTRASQVTSAFAGVMNLAGRASVALSAALAIAAPAAYFSRANDEARVTLARITGITDSLDRSRVVYSGLVADAIRLRVGLDDTLSGYTRIGMAVKELGGSARMAREINEIIIATAKTSGASQAEAAAAARQFAQALGSGVLQGDELRSILENNQELARRLAAGLGVSVGELRLLGEQGKLTADVVVRALQNQLANVRGKIADVPLTGADAWQKLTTSMEAWVHQSDMVEMKAGLIARTLNGVAEVVNKLREGPSWTGGAVAGFVAGTVPGAAPLVSDFMAQSNAAAVARRTLQEYEQEVERLDARFGSSELSVSQAKVKKSQEELNSVWQKAANDAEKYGFQVADLIGKLNTAEADLISSRAKQSRLGESTADTDQRLAALKRMREQLLAQIPLDLAEANKKTWDEFEKQTRIGVDRQIAQLERIADNASKMNAQRLAANQREVAVLEIERSRNLLTEQDYVARRKSLLDGEQEIVAESVRSERALLQEKIDAYKAVVAQIRARYGDEAAAASDAQKQVEAAQNKLIDVGKRRIEQNTKQTQSTAALTKVEIDLSAARTKAALESAAALDKLAENYAEATRARKEALEDEQFELTLIGQTDEQRQRSIALRKIDIETRKQLTAALKAYNDALAKWDGEDEAYLGQINEMYAKQKASILTNAEAQKQVTLEVIETGRQVEQSRGFWDGLFQSIKGGWKGVRDYVKNFFFDWLIKQLSQQFTMNIAVGGGGIGGLLGSIFGGGGGGAAGGASNAGGLLGSLLGVSGSGGGLAGLLGLGSTGGLLGGTALGAGYSLGAAGLAGGGLGGFMSGVGMAFQGGLLSGLGSLIPVIGPLIAIASIASALLKNKDGLWFDINGKTPGGGRSQNQFTTALGSKIQLHGEANIADAKPFVAQFQNLAQTFVDVFGKEIADKASLAANAFWTGFSDRGRGTEYENAQGYAAALATESKDVMAEYFSRVFSVVNTKIAETISTWEGTTEELVKYIQGVLAVQMSLKQQAPLLKAIIGETIDLNQVVELQREGENLSDTFTRLLNTFSVTNQIAQMMGKGIDAFGAVGLASLEARERLVALAGGLQALSADVTFYLEQFFSDAERRDMQVKLATQQLAAGFGDLGLAVPTTREEFRRMIDGLDLSTEAGARLYAALIKLAPALDLVLDAAESTAAPHKGRLAIDTTARDEFDRALDAYMEAMYTAEERLAMRRAELNRQIADTFNRLGIAVPASIEQFRELVNSIDRSTPAGQAMYEMLVRLAPAFAELANMAQQIVGGVWAGDVSAAAGAAIQGTWENLVAIIEVGSESVQVQLQRKLAAAQTLAGSAQAAYLDAVRRGVSGPALEQLRLQAAAAQQIYQQMGANMALFVSLQAQYGDRAADMFELEQWYQQQRWLAGDNAALLLMIEQSYQARRTQILTEGTTQGLSQLRATIKAWIDNLLLNNQLTTLTPEQQLNEARRQYEAALQSGDASAITRAADAYLQQARSFYASGSQYAAIFAAVLAQMQALAAGQNVPVVPTPQVPIVPTATAPGIQAAANRRAFDAESNAAAALSLARDALEAVASLTAENTRAIKDEASLSRESAARDADRLANKMAGTGQQRVQV